MLDLTADRVLGALVMELAAEKAALLCDRAAMCARASCRQHDRCIDAILIHVLGGKGVFWPS